MYANQALAVVIRETLPDQIKQKLAEATAELAYFRKAYSGLSKELGKGFCPECGVSYSLKAMCPTCLRHYCFKGHNCSECWHGCVRCDPSVDCTSCGWNICRKHAKILACGCVLCSSCDKKLKCGCRAHHCKRKKCRCNKQICEKCAVDGQCRKCARLASK